MNDLVSIAHLPGPRALPLLGNLGRFTLNRLHLDLEAWAERYGAIYRFSIARRPIVVISDPERILDILRNRPEGFRRLSAIETVNRELGIGGVFSAEGETWRRQRDQVMQGFDRTRLRGFFPVLDGIAQRLIRRWEPAAQVGQAFDTHADLMRYTVDVTTNFVFGCDLNTLESDRDPLQGHVAKILPMINRRVNAFWPYWRYWKLAADRDLERAMIALRKACDGFVADARAQLAASPERAAHPENLLEGLLAAQDEAGLARLSEAEIFGNTVTLLLAGEDTTAHTLAWLMLGLARYPQVQERLQAEVNDLPDRLEASDLDELPYVEAVIQETMRLKPVVPLLFLETNRDLAVGDVALPQGTGVMLLMRFAGIAERHFTSASEFRPERWLTPRDSARYPRHDRQVLMPFGAGSRFCPGRQLAFIEMKLAVAMICRNFHVSPDETAGPTRETFGFTMLPHHARVRLARRRAVALL